MRKTIFNFKKMKNIFLTLRSRCTDELDTKYEALSRRNKVTGSSPCGRALPSPDGGGELASYRQYKVETASFACDNALVRPRFGEC